VSCIEKLAHTCGSSDALQVFEAEGGGYTGYCFSCHTYVPNPYEDKPADYTPPTGKVGRSIDEIMRDVHEIYSEWQCKALPERWLEKEYLEYYGIKVAVSETDGVTPTLAALPIHRKGELVSYKLRDLDVKRMFSLGNGKEADMFGWAQAVASGAPRLIITEGEFDAVALFQAMKKDSKPEYAAFNPAVVSLTNGSGGAKREIMRHLEEIKRSFRDVVLAFDKDPAGDKAAEEVCKLLPTAMRAHLPAKDANACIDPAHYLGKALKNAVMFKASVPKNSKLVYGSSLKEAAQQEAEYGLSYPWPHLTALTRGERKGEVCYWGAAVKMGKSEILNALAAHSILAHGQKVFMAKPEEANAKTYKLLVGKAAGKIFHDPTVPFDHEAFEKYEPMIGDNVAMLDLYQHLTWDSVKQDIIHAAGEGYTTVYLDPITNFTNQVSAAEANEMLIAMAAEASSMAHDHKLSIHFFCHLLKPPSGSKPHERGGKVLSNQFSGSRGMMRSCNYMFGIEGNKDPELTEEERNMRQIVLLEDREFGQAGKVPLFWDKNTGLFTEV
jgi:twinkle protein